MAVKGQHKRVVWGDRTILYPDYSGGLIYIYVQHHRTVHKKSNFTE